MNLDQAQIDNAKAILEYTNVVAPIAGRTGIRQVDQGNIVRASDASGIVVITQLQPISVLFSSRSSSSARSTARLPVALPVDAFGPDNKTVADRRPESGRQPGRPATGTIKLKAEFPNPRTATVAGRLHQRAPAHAHAPAGGGGADSRGATRAERHLCLCREAGQQGGGSAGYGVAAG